MHVLSKSKKKIIFQPTQLPEGKEGGALIVHLQKM